MSANVGGIVLAKHKAKNFLPPHVGLLAHDKTLYRLRRPLQRRLKPILLLQPEMMANVRSGVTCGRRPVKFPTFFCSIGRVRSRVWPVDAALALMLCADLVPVKCMHSTIRWHCTASVQKTLPPPRRCVRWHHRRRQRLRTLSDPPRRMAAGSALRR